MLKTIIKYWRWPVGVVILIAFVAWTENTVGWQNIFNTWSSLSLSGLAAALFFLAASYLTRAGRIFQSFENTQWGPCVRIVLVHTASNNFLPVRSGELAFPIMMKKVFATPVSVAIPRLIWFRFLDAITLFSLAASLILAGYFSSIKSSLFFGFGFLMWALILVIIYYLRQPLIREISKRDSKWSGKIIKLVEGIPTNNSVRRQLELWTFFTWLLKLSGFVLLLQQFGELSLKTAILGVVGGELSSVLPVHGLAGTGTYEAGMLVVLGPMKIAVEQALPLAVSLHLFILGTSLLGVCLAMIPFPLWHYKTEKL